MNAAPSSRESAAPRPSAPAIDFGSIIALEKKAMGTMPRVVRWLDDGSWLELVSPPGADERRPPQLMRLDAATGRSTPLFDAESMRKAFAALPGINDKAAAAIAARRDLLFLPSFDGALVEHAGALYAHRFGGVHAARLSPRGKIEGVQLSPDGLSVAYVRKDDLHVLRVEDADERRLTTGGGEQLRRGRLDWVYQEEIYGRGNWDGFWWSPDSKRIAFLELDESPVGTYQVMDHIPVRGKDEPWRYPKAGDPNPRVRVGVVAAEGGDVTWVDLKAWPDDDRLVVRVDWTPDSSAVAVQVTDRIQSRLTLLFADPRTGVVRTVLREEGTKWAQRSPITWVGDDRFVWHSTRDGFRHLYLYRRDGTLERQLTSGEFEVLAVEGLDPGGAAVYAITNEAGILWRHLWRIPLDGSARTQITTGRGHHEAMLSPDCRWAIHRVHHAANPGEARLLSLPDGREVRSLGSGDAEVVAAAKLIEPEFLRVPNGRGVDLECMVIKPPGFRPGQKLPVLVQVYGGPHSPMVRDGFAPFRNAWHSELARAGYLVWVCDPHSASGKGDRAAWEMHGRAGQTELADIEASLDWLVEQGWADAGRVGIFGWSYGGFMASYALTHSKRFRCGIAGAPVTDWRNYDSVYTERYMNTPQANKDGYAASSVVRAAKDLHGRLLLIHGTMDENVHVANTLQLAEALQKAGHHFDLMLYPRSRHGINDPAQRVHLHTLMTRFLFEHL